MKKQIIRFFSLLMLAVLLVTAFAMQVNARVVFSDLAPTHWCYNKIIDFESKGYVCGYEDGTFKADQTITRAEYVKIVNNFFGYKPNTEKVANFSDVNSGDWFAPYVNEAVERGYITGFEDGTFRPQDPIRRQEATVILARILGIDKEVYPANHIDGLAQYSDSDEVQDWARVAIHSYSVYNFINGYTDGTLKILQNVTRAETVELLHVLEQKIIIDRKPGGSSKSTVKMPTIALYRFDKEANEFAAIKSSDLKSNWVNKAISTLSEDEYGVLVNVTSTTTGSTINEKLTGNKTGERKYITSKIEELTNAIFLTDGEYKISAFASKSGYHSSSSADKTILVDTKAPVVSGEVVTTLPVAHEQQVKVTVADPEASDVNRVSGLDTAKVRYAWFRYLGDGIYERATEWQNVTLDENGNAVITTEGLEYGTYKLAISAYDIAENAYGSEVDTVVTTSGDEEFREEVPYDFVEELEKEGEEKPEDPDITVIVGNNTPEVKDLVMRTEVNVEVSGKIVATDKDGDTLTYVLVENSGDSEYATVSGDTTSFEHGTAGTYYYNVEVSDGNGGTATVLVTVYVYDVKVVTPSGDKEDPVDYDVLADDLILYVGETKDVTASTTPKNEDATFEWNENSEEIEIVDDSQNNVTVIVEGKVPGKTTMNVTVKVGEVEITRTINVIVKGRKLTIHYVYEDGTIASEDKIIEEVGKDGYRITSPAVEGYTPDVAVVEGPMLTEDTEITVKYKANTDTKYTVEYYTENLDGKGYTRVDSKEETGTTGEQVSIDTSVTFTGFTFDNDNENNVLSDDVAGDGSLVLKAYYTRNSYKLSLVAGDNIASVTGEGTYKYEEEVTIDATLKDDAGYSYEFANWKSGDAEYSTSKNATVTMPANDLTLTANATRIANTDTKYTVEYYTEDLTEGNYTRVDSKEETGTTGEQVSIDTSRTFTGFTFDNDNENNVLSGEVAGNGSLVLKAYYTRNSYKLTLVAGKNVASVTGGGMHKYEEEVTIDATMKDEAGYSYSFENWKSGDAEYSTSKNAKVTMPANDLTLTANAIRTANTDTKYTVEYYTEDLDGKGYTKVDSKKETGTTGEQVSIDTSVTFTGFTFDSNNDKNVLSGEVAGNGSLVLKAYYTRNSYKLTLIAGDNVASVSGAGTYKYGQDVAISAVLEEIDGYTVTFDKWKANGGDDVDGQNTTITMPASDLTLTAIAKKTEKDPNVTIDIVADYPNNNKQAEPGDTIKYVATIENEESHEIKVKIDVDSDAADTIDSIIVYDKDGNLVKRYDNLDEEIVIPAGGNVKISYSSVVPKDCPVNEDKFTSTVTVSTVAGSLIKKETKSNSIEKSSDVLDATRKDKNVILILDLSGSMDENTKDGRTTKIAALRTAARQFVDKLYASSKETNTRVTLNVIGIGEAHDRSGFFGIGAYTSPSKKNGKGDPILLDDRYNGCDAYLIGSYINTNQGTWISSSLIKSKLKPDGGTNIVGSLKLANGIMDETYGQANGINDYIKGADNYVVILTDGANGPSANKPISKDTDGLKYSTALRNSGAGIYAIYFEGNDPEANEIGKTDLNTILDGKYPLYEASSSDSLNMAFDSIASSINKVQSNKGIITAVLPDTGAYFPIIVTYTENGEEKELFKVTKKSELEDRKMKVTSDGKSLEWDLTGTDYSELEGLKLKLTLGANATDGEETQSTLELLLTESGDLSSVTLVVNTENEENISEDSDVEKDDEIVSSGDVKVEEEPKVEEKNEEQQKEPKAEEKNEEQQKEPKVEEKNEEQQEEPKTEEKNEEQQKEPKAEEKNEEQQEEPKVEENNEEQQEDPKTEEKNEEQQEEPKVEEKNEEQQEEPKAEEKNEEQQEESKVEENKDEEQEEPKAEEKNEQQQEIKIEEEKKDEIIAVEPQVPSTEPQKTSTDKDDEQE